VELWMMMKKRAGWRKKRKYCVSVA